MNNTKSSARQTVCCVCFSHCCFHNIFKNQKHFCNFLQSCGNVKEKWLSQVVLKVAYFDTSKIFQVLCIVIFSQQCSILKCWVNSYATPEMFFFYVELCYKQLILKLSHALYFMSRDCTCYFEQWKPVKVFS